MIPESCTIKLRGDASVCRIGDEISFHIPGRAGVTIHDPSPAVLDSLMRLREGATEYELACHISESGSIEDLARFHLALLGLQKRNVLEYLFSPEPALRAVVRPLSGEFAFDHRALDPAGPIALSRFAYLRRADQKCVLESPLADTRMELQGWAAPAIIAALATPQPAGEVHAATGSIPEAHVRAFLDLLFKAGFLEQGQSNAGSAPETWEFHDLLFHRASRLGRNTGGLGGTLRFQGRVAEPPPLKETPETSPIPLFRPDLDKLSQQDPPFTRVIESRRSVRDAAGAIITAEQLGEFLFRVAHIQRQEREWILRCYPSAGARHELEIYPVVGRCVGLEPALYYYHSLSHSLYPLPSGADGLEKLLDTAAEAMHQKDRPQVLLVTTARFARMAWKYEGIAYRNTLLDVGAAMQTMYLAATAMKLSPCALGGGAPARFARDAGLDPLIEDSIAEFALSGARLPLAGEATAASDF